MNTDDQQTFRLQLREFKLHGKDALNARAINGLHQKYCREK
jgi:hypothetical protein